MEDTLTEPRGVAFIDNARRFRAQLEETASRLGIKTFYFLERPSGLKSLIANNVLRKVFCDWKLPKCNGIEVLLDVKKRFPKIECVLLTGYKSQLTKKEKEDLKSNGINVEVKDVICEDWVAVQAEEYCPNRGQGNDSSHEKENANNGETPQSQSEALAIARLERDKYKSLFDQQQRIMTIIAEGLADDLLSLPDDFNAGLFGSGRALSIADLVEHIRKQTPFGLKLLEIDRKMQNQFRGRKVK